jgi:hypothetical protein
MKSSVLFIFFLFISTLMFGQETKKSRQDLLSIYPLPTVDRRTELLSIDFRLAGNFNTMMTGTKDNGRQVGAGQCQ